MYDRVTSRPAVPKRTDFSVSSLTGFLLSFSYVTGCEFSSEQYTVRETTTAAAATRTTTTTATVVVVVVVVVATDEETVTVAVLTAAAALVLTVVIGLAST